MAVREKERERAWSEKDRREGSVLVAAMAEGAWWQWQWQRVAAGGEAEWHWEDRKFGVPGSRARVSRFQGGHNFHELSNCPAKFRRTAAPPARCRRRCRPPSSPPSLFPLPQPQLTAARLQDCGMGKVGWLGITIRVSCRGGKKA